MAVEIAKVECVEVGDNGKYGRFVVEPLERGFVTRWATACAVSCYPLCPERRRLLFTSKVCSMNFPPFPA